MEKSYHLTPEAFRYWGHQVIDWIASEYYEKLEEFPVLAQVKPGEIRSHLPDTPPIEGESVDAILKDFADIIVPGLTQWQSPNWFAYYPSNSSPITVIAELLIAAVNNQGMLWQTSPSCTELETLMTDWFVQALGLPDHFQHKQGGGGVLQDSASSGCLCAMIAARKQALDREQEEQSWFSSVDKSVQPQLNEFSQLDKSRNILTKIKMVVKHLLENQQKPGLQRLSAYISSETHASVIKNFRILFGGTQNLRIIPVDEQFGMRSDLLEKQICDDRGRGLIPFFCCATVGTTSSGAIDPVAEIGRICEANSVWLHVDAAHYGTAAICPEYRFVNDGVEKAESYSVNAHKWFPGNFDCSFLFLRNPSALIDALSITPEYLRNRPSELGFGVVDYRDWQIPLGRRFRSLKVWFAMRQLGLEGLRYHIERHIELTKKLEQLIRHSDFELVVPPILNLLCFRYPKGDEFNQLLLESVNQTGKLFLSHTKLNGRFVMRFCISQTYTQERHVEQAWNLVQGKARELLKQFS